MFIEPEEIEPVVRLPEVMFPDPVFNPPLLVPCVSTVESLRVPHAGLFDASTFCNAGVVSAVVSTDPAIVVAGSALATAAI